MEDILYFLSMDDVVALLLFLAGIVGCSLFFVRQFELPILGRTFTQKSQTIASNINSTHIETYPVPGKRKGLSIFLNRLKQADTDGEGAGILYKAGLQTSLLL